LTARKFKPRSETVDFVVGSGAAGGVMARELSQAGYKGRGTSADTHCHIDALVATSAGSKENRTLNMK
jgi:hypothetical protein